LVPRSGVNESSSRRKPRENACHDNTRGGGCYCLCVHNGGPWRGRARIFRAPSIVREHCWRNHVYKRMQRSQLYVTAIRRRFPENRDTRKNEQKKTDDVRCARVHAACRCFGEIVATEELPFVSLISFSRYSSVFLLADNRSEARMHPFAFSRNDDCAPANEITLHDVRFP